ncbi:MAG TPA: hypothetical protein VHF50_06385, partial [Solirubrobacterales bacterium]|nr:hypothetical protein [Solirubrobacterales bacterium]
LIENSKNLCRFSSRATVRMGAHNGRRLDFRPKVANTCRKKGRKGAKGRRGQGEAKGKGRR